MKKSSNLYKIISPEAIFVFYCWGFTLLKYLLHTFRNYSTIILMAYLFMLCAITAARAYSKESLQKKNLILLFAVFSLYFIDMIFRRNEYTLSNLFTFCIYGGITLVLISLVKDYKKVLEYFYIFSVVNFILYFYDPLINYNYFGDYMGFGLNLALPAYSGMFIGRKYLNKKSLFFLEILCLIELIIYSNRSVILAVVFFWLINWEIKKKTAKACLIYLCSFFVLVNFIILIKHILLFCINLLYTFDTSSFALERIYRTLSDFDITYLFAGRLELWNNAIDMIKNHFLFGTGTGGYQALYHTHPHNIILDVWSQYGVLVLISFFILIIFSIWRMRRSNRLEKILLGAFLSMWFPLLFLSNTFYSSIYFWGFIALGLKNKKIYKIDCKMEDKYVSTMF